MISPAGHEVMMKSVLAVVPAYIMSCFAIPKAICDWLDQKMIKFFWGEASEERKRHWIWMDFFFLPKRLEGLSLKRVQ